MAAEPGREPGVRLDSRDVDMPLEKRRMNERGREMGVTAREPASSARSNGRSVPRLKLARGVRVRFCPTLALTDRAFPYCPSLTERAGGGVASVNGEFWFMCG